MAAVDNTHLLEILSINLQSGKSRRTGNDYEIHKAQCVLRGPDGSIQVGELNLPKEMKEVVPGKYLAEFKLGINYDRLVVPVLTKLHAHGDTAKAASPSPKTA